VQKWFIFFVLLVITSHLDITIFVTYRNLQLIVIFIARIFAGY